MSKRLFVTGIGTGVGKTICAAILAKYWNLPYWKPIQSGDLANSDRLMIQHLIGHDHPIFPERYRLKEAASPHQSAAKESIQIQLSDFELPDSEKGLLVEGAGGLFVPINEQDFIIDLIEQLNLDVALVCRDYLGCINHTLMSMQVLQTRNLNLTYLVLNGTFNPATERIIVGNCPPETNIIRIPAWDGLKPEDLTKVISAVKFQ